MGNPPLVPSDNRKGLSLRFLVAATTTRMSLPPLNKDRENMSAVMIAAHSVNGSAYPGERFQEGYMGAFCGLQKATNLYGHDLSRPIHPYSSISFHYLNISSTYHIFIFSKIKNYTVIAPCN
jgi:hypothetical protein